MWLPWFELPRFRGVWRVQHNYEPPAPAYRIKILFRSIENAERGMTVSQPASYLFTSLRSH